MPGESGEFVLVGIVFQLDRRDAEYVVLLLPFLDLHELDLLVQVQELHEPGDGKLLFLQLSIEFAADKRRDLKRDGNGGIGDFHLGQVRLELKMLCKFVRFPLVAGQIDSEHHDGPFLVANDTFGLIEDARLGRFDGWQRFDLLGERTVDRKVAIGDDEVERPRHRIGDRERRLRHRLRQRLRRHQRGNTKHDAGNDQNRAEPTPRQVTQAKRSIK